MKYTHEHQNWLAYMGLYETFGFIVQEHMPINDYP